MHAALGHIAALRNGHRLMDELKERAARPMARHRGEYETEYAAGTAYARQPGA
jgi:hypothetical protein